MRTEPEQRYTPEISVNLRVPSDVQTSPDGQRVAFVVSPIAHLETNPATEIWVAEIASDSRARRFTTARAEERMPRWSPDGTRLAFLSDRAERGTAQVHLLDASGGEAVALTSLRRGADLISWSSDGSSISFTADRLALSGQQDPPGEIYVASLADRPRVIMQVPLDGGEPQVIGPANGHVWLYAWSRDGQSVAAITTESNRLDDTLGNVRFVIIDVVTHAERLLATLPFVPSLVQWSPDGTQIVILNETGDVPDDIRVILFDSRSGDRRTLEPEDTTPAWAGWVGDGSRLLVLTAEGFWTPVELVDLSTHVTQRLMLLPAGGTIAGPLSLSDDGQTVALVWQDPNTPPEVWAGALDGSLTCLTHLNPELDGLSFGTMEPIEWPASDGITIQGWLCRPPRAPCRVIG